jgi:hypothetical protein
VAIYLPNNIEYLVTIFGECYRVQMLDILLTRYSLRFLRPDTCTASSQPPC